MDSLAVTHSVAPLAQVSPEPGVATTALTDTVLEKLRKGILSGAYAPGDRLPESRTAMQLGVSRVPVREAMLQLEREGLLRFDARGGAVVRELTTEDFEEIFSLRLVLEPMAAALACRRARPEDFEAMRANLAAMRSVTRLLDLTLLDVEFHDLIMRASRHSRLLQSWRGLKPQLEVWLHRMHRQIDAPEGRVREVTVQGHEDLLQSLIQGDPAEASERIRRHTEGWREQLPRPDSFPIVTSL